MEERGSSLSQAGGMGSELESGLRSGGGRRAREGSGLTDSSLAIVWCTRVKSPTAHCRNIVINIAETCGRRTSGSREGGGGTSGGRSQVQESPLSESEGVTLGQGFR